MSDLKRTPLYDIHATLGGQLVPFANWDMPVRYSSILDEARAVRTNAGLFDVSHMGRIDINGPDAETLLDGLYSSSIPKLKVGRGRYGVLCNESGGIIDDCILYRFGADRFRLVPNASNTSAVLNWIHRWKTGTVEISDATNKTAMIAHQGPESQSMLQGLTSFDLSSLKSFNFIECDIAGVAAIIARTGYTGEDGFEFMVQRDKAVKIWSALSKQGAVPCGLGARDVLRLEAGLLLHGNDMSPTINPYEAGLHRFVNPDRDGYIAREALTQIREAGTERKLIGFSMDGRGAVPRHGYTIMSGENRVGEVSSGSYSPTLDRNIGFGYVRTHYGTAGTRLTVDIRGRMTSIMVVPIPFYPLREN